MGPAEEKAAFEKKIKDNPSETVNYLVFADWLDEHGDHFRAKMERATAMLVGLVVFAIAKPGHLSRLRGWR